MTSVPHKSRSAALPLLLLVSSLVLPLSAAAQADVSPLQAMIDAAAPGDTVRVPAGVYEGPIHIAKPLALFGDHYPIVRGSRLGSVITIEADSCTIDGFVIEASGLRLMKEDAGIQVSSRGNRITNNRFRDNAFGIYLMQAHQNLIKGNRIRGRSELIEADRGNGIHLWNAHDNRIEENEIGGTRDGIYFSFARRNLVKGNEIHDVRYGLHYMYSDSNSFRENLFSRNVAGAAVMYSKQIFFDSNAFVHNRGHRAFGILLQSVIGVRAVRNWIVDNRVGLQVDNASSCEFNRNMIAKNDAAVQLFASAADNVFWQNNFVDNLAEIQLEGRPQGNLWSRSGVGNFWSGYRGFDWNEDGVGERPYHIRNVFDYLTLSRPEFTLYLFSPASQAIEATERLMPIVDAPEQIDPHPLLEPTPVDTLPMRAVGKSVRPSGRWAAVGLTALLGSFSVLALWKGQRR